MRQRCRSSPFRSERSCSSSQVVLLRLVTLVAGFSVDCVSGLNVARGKGYDYRQHGQDWSSGQCASRERQSPIDFADDAPWACQPGAPAPNPCFRGQFFYEYDPVEDNVTLRSDGSSLIADLSGKGVGGITIDGAWFHLTTIKFHAASEHTFRRQHLPLEAQLVHVSDDFERIVIVAVPIATAASPLATGVADFALPGALLRTAAPRAGAGSAPQVVPLADPEDLVAPLVAGGTFFEYAGSLTSPPCTEQVTWLVRREPLTLATPRMALVREAVGLASGGAENWRAPMPLMQRTVSVMLAAKGPPPLPPTSGPGAPPAPPPLVFAPAPFRGVTLAKEAMQYAMHASAVGARIAAAPDNTDARIAAAGASASVAGNR